MKINKYDESRDVFIHKDGVIFQPTKTNKQCKYCKHGIEGVFVVECKKHNCLCGGNYHCKYFKKRIVY